MTKIKKITFALLAVLQSGCTNHSIIKPKSPQDNAVCELVNANIELINQNPNTLSTMIGNGSRPISLGIKKIDANNLKVRVRFTPGSSKEDPLKKPGVILKLYKNGNMFQEYKFTGDRYTGYEILTSQGANVKDIVRIPAGILLPLLEEKVVEFSLTPEQFNKVLESDLARVLIQTQYDPIIAFIEKDDFIPLREFKKECLS